MGNKVKGNIPHCVLATQQKGSGYSKNLRGKGMDWGNRYGQRRGNEKE
jgi:hypothetical protein